MLHSCYPLRIFHTHLHACIYANKHTHTPHRQATTLESDVDHSVWYTDTGELLASAPEHVDTSQDKYLTFALSDEVIEVCVKCDV